MKNLIFLSLLIFCISCVENESATYKEMKSDQLMSDFFEDNELKDLAKIVDFFESQICQKYGNKENCEVQKAYKRFNIADSIEYVDNSSFLIFIDYNKQKELYKDLDTNLLYKIWSHPFVIPKTKNEKMIEIKDAYHLSCFKDYINFIEIVGKNNITKYRMFKKYAESSKEFCGISIQNTLDLTVNYRFFDTKDIKTRLLFAIHYLSTEEELIQPQL